jgi:hypothetical protein
MKNTLALAMLVATLIGGTQAFAAVPSGNYPLQLAHAGSDLTTQEKRIDQHLINNQGWDRRADKYVRTTRGTYDHAVQRYELDQKRHASANQLSLDKTAIDRAKQKLDLALADQRRSQSILNKAQAAHSQYEGQLRNQQAAAGVAENQIQQRVMNKQGWDRRADKYVRTTRGTYDRLVNQYEKDQRSHVSAKRLSLDKARVERAKQRFNVALADQRRSQNAVNQADKQLHSAIGQSH